MTSVAIGTRVRSGAIALALTVTGCVEGRPPGAANAGREPSNAESEILAVDQERSQALARNDVEALARLYSDDFMMITSTGEIRTKEDQLRDVGSGQAQHRGSPDRILKLRTYGDVAVVESESGGRELILDGRPDPSERRYTRVYAKADGRWQLVATHISKVEAPKQ